MTLTRSQLVGMLLSAEAAIENSSDRFAGWTTATEPMRAGAGADDREWLVDHLNNLGNRLGLPAERAEIQRLLDSRGMTHHGDEDPEPGPHPLFAAFRVSATQDGVPPSAPLSLFRDSGMGTTTWGVLQNREGIWIADARPGATLEDIADKLSLLQAYANARSLRIEVPGMDVLPASDDLQQFEAFREDYRL